MKIPCLSGSALSIAVLTPLSDSAAEVVSLCFGSLLIDTPGNSVDFVRGERIDVDSWAHVTNRYR